MIDPAPIALMRDARAAGRRTGVLSNDAYTFVGREFFADGRSSPTSTPSSTPPTSASASPTRGRTCAPPAALGVPPDEVVFLDDTPECVDGATRVGMAAILVDPLDKTPAFDQARESAWGWA